MAPHRFERSRTYPVSEQVAFDRTLALPLPKLFRHRFGPIPPIKDVQLHGDSFDAVGDSRTILLKGGGSMREELVEVDRPWVFRYRITDVTGPTKPLIDHIDGAWTFEPIGTGVRVTWSWTVHPRSGAAAKALPVLRRFWSGYARRALEVLEAHLLR
jgi:hypothetical protein